MKYATRGKMTIVLNLLIWFLIDINWIVPMDNCVGAISTVSILFTGLANTVGGIFSAYILANNIANLSLSLSDFSYILHNSDRPLVCSLKL